MSLDLQLLLFIQSMYRSEARVASTGTGGGFQTTIKFDYYSILTNFIIILLNMYLVFSMLTNSHYRKNDFIIKVLIFTKICKL